MPSPTLQHGMLHVALLLLACATLEAPGVEPFQPRRADPLLEPWRHSVLPDLSGLGAQCMTEASDGRFWFGSADGLWTYDGFHWLHHPAETLGIGSVHTVCRADDGAIFAGGLRGFGRFDRTGWKMLVRGDASPLGIVRKLAAAPDGSVWAATPWGALRWRSAEWTLLTSATLVESARAQTNLPIARVESLPGGGDVHDLTEVSVGADGLVWFGTARGEILRHDPGTPDGAWSRYGASDGLASGTLPSILPLPGGQAWVVYRSGSGFLHRFDGVRWTQSRLTEAGLPAECGDLMRTRDGARWLSGRYMIAAFRDGAWQRYEKPAVPIPSAWNFLLQASDGALWVGGPNTEIVRFEYDTPRWVSYQDLNFQWEGPDETQWFLHRSGRVIRKTGETWTSLGPEDGLMDAPVALLGTRNGEVWVAGSHQHAAATARFDGRAWTRFIHQELSWGIDRRAVLESSDGSLWFGAAVDSKGPKEHRAGLLQYRNGTWIHHHQPGRAPSGAAATNPAVLLPPTQRPEPTGKFYCLGETADGRIWAGRTLLAFHDGNQWTRSPAQGAFPGGTIEATLTTPDRTLWLGTRQGGVWRNEGSGWVQFRGKDSLSANSIRSLAQTADGSLWVATERGFSRFDGQVWTPDVLPPDLLFPHEGGALAATASGMIWINKRAPGWNYRAWAAFPGTNPPDAEFRTVGHRMAGPPPETSLDNPPTSVAHGGNLSMIWDAAAPWRPPGHRQLQFSHRVDDLPWSAYTFDPGHTFLGLAAGRHRLEVRARDADFNVDPTPAVVEFVVLPPIWRQPWFVGLVLLLTGLAGTQSVRIVRERRRLRDVNRDLASEITVRQRAEAAARDSEDRFRSLIAASPDAITTTDLEGTITLASAKALEVFRVASQELARGRPVLEWVSPGDRSRVMESLRQLVSTGNLPFRDFVLLRSDGTTFDAEVNASLARTPEGTPSGLIIITRDVTEAKRSADRLRKLSRAVEQSPASIVITDTAGRIEYTNPRFTEMTGFTRDEVLGQLPRILQPGELPTESSNELRAAIAAGQSWSGEFRDRRKTGEPFWELASVSHVHDAQGSVTHHVVTLRDVTQEKHLEAQLRQSQKLEAIGLLAGGVAHDFNNILAAMMMQVGLAKRSTGLPAEVDTALQEIRQSAERAADLIRQLLLFSCKQVMQPRSLDLNAAVSHLAKMLQRIIGEDVRLQLTLAPGPLWVHADAGMLDQVLLNLAVNARDAMPHGGRLLIETSVEGPDSTPGNAAERQVRLSVGDTGTGIPEDVLPHIFDPFFTTKAPGKGTGLGLSTVFGIVKQHGGTVGVESRVGEGTRFHVLLPWHETRSQPTPGDTAGLAARGGQETILLVEDEASVRSVTRKVLGCYGYKIIEASHGSEAIELWQRDRNGVDVLITDLVMPGGMTGQQLASRLQQERPDLRVVYISGYSPETSGRRLQLGPRERFVQKPFSPEELLEAIRGCLEP